MKFLLHTKESIAGRVLEYLKHIAQVDAFSGNESVAGYDLLVLDPKTCGPSSESQDQALLKEAFDKDRAVLVLNAADEQKQVLAAFIGFRSHGSGMAYLVIPLRDGAGRTHHRIFEQMFPTSMGTLGRMDARGDGERLSDQSELVKMDLQDSSEKPELPEHELRAFGERLRGMLQPGRAAEGMTQNVPSGLKWKTWDYSQCQCFTASGGKSRLGTPPEQYISCLTTYEFQAYLNNWPETGPFQYVFLKQSGIYQTNGMSRNWEREKGWYLTQLAPTYNAAEELFYYQSSPANVSDSKDVTTSSGFEVNFNTGGAGASYNFSSSETQRIFDWKITQLAGTKWRYMQKSPYPGDITTFPSSMVQKKGVLKELSDISKYSLQFDVQVVWKTNSVVKKNLNITCLNYLRADYIITEHTSGDEYEGHWWYSNSTYSPTITIDLSLVS